MLFVFESVSHFQEEKVTGLYFNAVFNPNKQERYWLLIKNTFNEIELDARAIMCHQVFIDIYSVLAQDIQHVMHYKKKSIEKSAFLDIV